VDVSVRVQDPSGNVTRDVHMHSEDSHRVVDLVDALVAVMEWPRDTLAGEPLVYHLRRLGSERPFDSLAPVSTLGLIQGETLILGPRGGP
jgi:hypothetical protein